MVRYPSSYSYSGEFATRSLTPVPGYAAGSSTFTAVDITTTISFDGKYRGGVLGPNGLIYFVPVNADNIGKLHLGNTQPAYEVAGGVPEAWHSLLSPHLNKF